MDVWQHFAIGLAMVFVLEGMAPFLMPGHWKRYLVIMSKMGENTARVVGLASMLTGLAILYLAN